MLCHWEPRCYVAVLFVLVHSVIEPIWKRYMDDTIVVIKTSKKDKFLKCPNSFDPQIHFSVEATREDGSIPFLDTFVMQQPVSSLITTVHRRPTQIYACSGTVTITWLVSSVSVTAYHTEQRLSVLIPNCLKRKKTTTNKHFKKASTQFCLYIGPASNPTSPTKLPTTSGTTQPSTSTILI